MSNVGGAMQNGANTATNILDKPANYFKGFAGQGLQNIGAKLGTQGGAIGTLGNGISSLGTTVAGGTGAGAATGAAAAGSAGTAAGTAGTVGGLTTAGTAGAAGGAAAGGAAAGSGAAAGGAAAGGSAAGGAAAAGPIGALIALGIMAATGANRKRAKKGGEALLQSTNQMSEQGNEEADQRLALTQQNAAALQEQAQNALQNGIMTGGAAPIKERSPIEEYQDYLRGAGYSDDIINGVPQGLNGGNKEIADWISQYNAGAGKNSPINIPQTDEEIAAAKAGTFNNLQTGNIAQTEQIKRGLFDKFVSGIGDLTRGYEENRNNAFAPTNLQDKTFTTDSGQTIDKGGMARIGEAMGTIGRMVNKPAVQALVADGLSTALTGNPLYSLGQAYKFGSNRAMGEVYKDVLNQYGVNVPELGMFGNISSNDMKNIGNMAETNAWHESTFKNSSSYSWSKIDSIIQNGLYPHITSSPCKL